MAKKFNSKFFFVICFAALYGFCIKAALSPTLPSPSCPLLLYSNQSRDDLRLILKKCFANARYSIDLWMYAVTDSLLLSQLEKKAAENVKVSIYFDKRGGTPSLPSSLHPHQMKSKGLMHRKIVLLDESIVILGSANMTTSSLQLHDNLSVGIYDPQMAQFIKSPSSKTYLFPQGLLWLLPDPNALQEIQARIDAARSSIFIAMFTLTQTDLIQALIRAKKRGVHVILALDRYTAQGASKKAFEACAAAGIEIYLSSGIPLLHHKWAYIDQEELILGSTNWTEAAFRKNEDVLLFLKLPPPLQSKIKSIASAIYSEGLKASN